MYFIHESRDSTRSIARSMIHLDVYIQAAILRALRI